MAEKMETLLTAVTLCAISILLLVGGFGIRSVRNIRETESVQFTSDMRMSEDIIGEMISEYSLDSLQDDFAGVNIITWDEYYELSGQPVKEEYKRGIYGTLKEEDWPMVEAGYLVLSQLQELEEIEPEGMYLMMVLANASSSQSVDIWRGYLCNYLAGAEMSESARVAYYLQMNAYTGEVLRIEKQVGREPAQIILDNSSKTVVVAPNNRIDFSAVPMCTLEEYFQLSKQSFEVTSEQYQYGRDGYLSMKEAGLLVLKEIHRLFDEDMVDMKLVMSFSDGKWGGWLLNDTKSYSFRMDARSGKIWWLSGGELQVTYSGKQSMTDVQIIANTRRMIEKYHIANVKNVDWSKVVVYNATEDNKWLFENNKGKTNSYITNYVEFTNDEGELMRVSTDWETGELRMILNKDYWYLYE